MPHALRLEGLRFGGLVVERRIARNKQGHWMWECSCECGNKVNKVGADLKRGVAVSCGCRMGGGRFKGNYGSVKRIRLWG